MTDYGELTVRVVYHFEAFLREWGTRTHRPENNIHQLAVAYGLDTLIEEYQKNPPPSIVTRKRLSDFTPTRPKRAGLNEEVLDAGMAAIENELNEIMRTPMVTREADIMPPISPTTEANMLELDEIIREQDLLQMPASLSFEDDIMPSISPETERCMLEYEDIMSETDQWLFQMAEEFSQQNRIASPTPSDIWLAEQSSQPATAPETMTGGGHVDEPEPLNFTNLFSLRRVGPKHLKRFNTTQYTYDVEIAPLPCVLDNVHSMAVLPSIFDELFRVMTAEFEPQIASASRYLAASWIRRSTHMSRGSKTSASISCWPKWRGSIPAKSSKLTRISGSISPEQHFPPVADDGCMSTLRLIENDMPGA